MELNNQVRERIIDAIRVNRENYPSDNKHAAALGLSTSVYNAVKKGKVDKQVSDSSFISIARRLGVNLKNEITWHAAETPTFMYVSKQLEMCQQSSLSGLLCDVPNIGKTFTAKAYVKTHPNSIYVDCGQVKTKMRMIRFIAKEFGINSNGRYADVYDDLVYYLRSIERPLIILDEAGDMNYETFAELKALWNATDKCCAWYMMGANGLKKKIRLGMERETNSYAEMFSRYGDRYNRVTPEDEKERMLFLKAQAAIVIKVNAPEGININKLVNLSEGRLRRVYTEIEKIVTGA